MGSSYTDPACSSRASRPASAPLSDPTVRDGIRDLLQSRREEVLRAAYISSPRNGAVDRQ